VTATDDSANDATVVTVPGTAVIAGRWTLGSYQTAIPTGGTLNPALGAANANNTAGWVTDATSVTVPEAGWYHVDVSGQVNNGATAGGGFLAPTYNGTSSGEQQGGSWAVNGVERFSENHTVYLAAGTKVGAAIFSYNAGAQWFGGELAINKVNGAKGDTGPAGGTMGATVGRWNATPLNPAANTFQTQPLTADTAKAPDAAFTLVASGGGNAVVIPGQHGVVFRHLQERVECRTGGHVGRCRAHPLLADDDAVVHGR
jgi:hypothetical protein